MLKEVQISREFYSEQPMPLGPYELSMFIGSDFFMYAISNENHTHIVELCHVELTGSNTATNIADAVTFLVENYSLQKKKFDKVNVSVLSGDFNLIPEAFVTDTSLKPLMQFTTGILPLKTPFAHRIKDFQLTYSIDTELLSYLERTFVNASIRHCGAVTIALLSNQHSLSACDVFINVHNSAIELAVSANGQLQFYNIFSYQSDEDILYYLLFTMEQFNLNPLFVKLCVAAQRPLTDELFTSMKKYIKNVTFSVGDRSVLLTGDLTRIPQHYYFTLLNQHTCEL